MISASDAGSTPRGSVRPARIGAPAARRVHQPHPPRCLSFEPRAEPAGPSGHPAKRRALDTEPIGATEEDRSTAARPAHRPRDALPSPQLQARERSRVGRTIIPSSATRSTPSGSARPARLRNPARGRRIDRSTLSRLPELRARERSRLGRAIIPPSAARSTPSGSARPARLRNPAARSAHRPLDALPIA
jgi:hypothetical protein